MADLDIRLHVHKPCMLLTSQLHSTVYLGSTAVGIHNKVCISILYLTQQLRHVTLAAGSHQVYKWSDGS